MNPIRSATLLVLAALATPPAGSLELKVNLKDVTNDELKQAYLACDRAVMAGQLSTIGVHRCSIIYEQLKRQVFDGDFERLLAWSRLHPSVRNTRGGAAAPE